MFSASRYALLGTTSSINIVSKRNFDEKFSELLKAAAFNCGAIRYLKIMNLLTPYYLFCSQKRSEVYDILSIGSTSHQSKLNYCSACVNLVSTGDS